MPPWILFWHGFFVTFVINHFFQQDGNGHVDQHDALESAGTSCTNINQTNKRNVETYIYIVICRVTFPSLFTSSFASTHQHSLCLPKKSVTGYLENLKYQTKRQILPFLLDSPASFDRKVLYQLLQLGCRWPSWSSRKKRTRLSLALDSSGVQIATEKKGGTRYG